MKLNQWTLGLAAVGVVSLASAVNAEEKSVTINGYVDTSINWNSIDNCLTPPIKFTNGKSDGFNLNVVKLSLEKAMDESEYASGYKVDLLFGPDAVGYNNSPGAANSDLAIKQAYAALRTPVGNGIDWKVGVFDGIVGYESFDKGNNPNFTHSYGHGIEPTQHTGVLGTYRISDTVAVAAGVANTLTAGINARPNDKWDETWMASIAVTAPQDMGCLSGSTLYAGVVTGFAGRGKNQDNYYVGATLNTPVTGLKAGVAFDYATDLAGVGGDDAWSLAGYLSYQATEKLGIHGRAEYVKADRGFRNDGQGYALTGTAQYDLWANVISRLEVRYDQLSEKTQGSDHSTGLYANFIYKF